MTQQFDPPDFFRIPPKTEPEPEPVAEEPVPEPEPVSAPESWRPDASQSGGYVVTKDVQESPEPEPEPEGRKPDEPLTGDEIKGAATDLYTHAKEVWLQPVRKEIRSWFRAGREFLDSLGTDADQRKK